MSQQGTAAASLEAPSSVAARRWASFERSMKRTTTLPTPITMIEHRDWQQVGGSIGFHCLGDDCDRMVWTMRCHVDERGLTTILRECPCGWSGRARFSGFLA